MADLALDPSIPSHAFKVDSARWPLVRALMGGTAAMRVAGELYLPREPAETVDAYEVRRKRSTLFNGYAKTVRDMAGKVFARPIALGPDVPPALVGYAENIDLTGRRLDVFARALFEDAEQAGISFVLVDMPPAVPGATRADDLVAGRRPYFVHVPAERLIGFRSQIVDGVEVLTQARILEDYTVENGPYNEDVGQQVRILRPGSFEIWRQAVGNDGKSAWFKFSEGPVSVSRIPLVPVYLKRTGFFRGSPTYQDLADLNVAHWQSASDQRTILHVARVPILFAAGFPDEGPALKVGASTLTTASDPAARLEFVEHSGAAIAAGREDLKDLEFQMQVFGLELQIPKPGNATATGAAIDQAAMNSDLAMMAGALEDALEGAFGFMAEFDGLGRDAGGSLTVNKDFGISLRAAEDVRSLLEMRKLGEISQETFIDEIKRRGVLSDGVEAADERERIADEGPALGDPMALPANDPGPSPDPATIAAE